MLTVVGIGHVILVASACGRTNMKQQTFRNASTYQYNTHRHRSGYVGATGLMHMLIRKYRLEIGDKIVDGLGKCFISVLYFILPYNKITLYYSSDMERSRLRI